MSARRLGNWGSLGVDALAVIRCFAQPRPPTGGSASYLGMATYGQARPDIGELYGTRLTNSGYLFTATLTPGTYTLTATHSPTGC